MNDEQQQELYRAIVINPFKESEDQDLDLEALKQSAIDLYNDIMSALNEAESESENESGATKRKGLPIVVQESEGQE